jgi:hypothetical protein
MPGLQIITLVRDKFKLYRVARTKTKLLVGIFILGVVILILPDKGAPLIRLNEAHGPSLTDMVGLLMIIVGWAGLSYLVVRNWKTIDRSFRRTNARLLLALYFISILGIVMALQVKLEWMLWMSVAIATIINATFVIVALTRRISSS